METRDRGPGPPPPSDSPSNEPHDDRGLPALLLARAAERPERPWLFVQRGLDWRWRSFGAVAMQVERLRAALVEGLAGLPQERAGGGPAPRIGFEDDGGPDAIALDLAIQAAGACAAPLPPGLAGQERAAAAAQRGCAALAAIDAGAGSAASDARGRLPAPAGAADAAAPAPDRVPVPAIHLPGEEPSEPAAAVPAVPWRAGAVLVTEAPRRRELSAAELIAEVEELGARLSPPRPPRGPRPAAARRRARRERDVLVLPRPLDDPAGRRLAAWSLATGAALVLEPERAFLAATAAWVRPTVFAGDSAEIAALQAEVEARRRRRRGLPLGRLHTVAVLEGPPLTAAEVAFWNRRGTAVAVV